MPKINKTDLYLRNAYGTFFGGYKHFDIYPIDPLIWVIHTFLLPVSTTLGAATKTLIDAATRKELSDEDISKIESSLQALPVEQFDQFIKNITKYQAKSNGSQILIENLSDRQRSQDRAIELFELREKKQILQIKLNELKNKNPENLVYFKFDVNANCKLDKIDEKNLQLKVDEFKQQENSARRKSQFEFIKNYLHADFNAGKKLQHVIKGEVDELSKNQLRP